MNDIFKDLIFKPIIPLTTMLLLVIPLLIIILINGKKIIRRFLIVLLALLISQRPMLKNQDDIAYNRDIDVIFVVDNTVSMNAIDGRNGQTRLENVKEDCMHIMNNLEGCNFAIISYNHIWLVKYPFTDDVSVIKDVIDRLKIIDPNYAIGSTLNMPYENMKLLLESSRSKDKHKTMVFFMGDGELTEKEASMTDLSQYKEIADLIDAGAVLGYGTKEGAKVKITESISLSQIVDSSGFLIDSSTNPPKIAISRMNDENLKKVSENLSIDYYYMDDFSVLAKQLDRLKTQAEEKESDDEVKANKDIYYYFSGAEIILLLLELLYCRRNEQ